MSQGEIKAASSSAWTQVAQPMSQQELLIQLQENPELFALDPEAAAQWNEFTNNNSTPSPLRALNKIAARETKTLQTLKDRSPEVAHRLETATSSKT